MKKIIVMGMCMSVVFLTGCWKDKEVVVNEAPVVKEQPAVVADIPTGEFSQYQLNVNIVSTDVDGNEYGVKTTMYKKDDKSLYVINEMTGPQELPFTPTQNLLVGTDLYSNIDMNGENMWFKAANIDEQGGAMFDLEIMQEQLLLNADMAEVKEEEINGTTMTCYYMPDSAGKICLVDGIFAYGEDADPVSGMKSVIEVSNYSTEVDESVFVIPNEEDVKDMSEFMEMMMEQLQAEGADIAVVTEDELTDGEEVVVVEAAPEGVEPEVAPEGVEPEGAPEGVEPEGAPEGVEPEGAPEEVITE